MGFACCDMELAFLEDHISIGVVGIKKKLCSS